MYLEKMQELRIGRAAAARSAVSDLTANQKCRIRMSAFALSFETTKWLETQSNAVRRINDLLLGGEAALKMASPEELTALQGVLDELVRRLEEEGT